MDGLAEKHYAENGLLPYGAPYAAAPYAAAPYAAAPYAASVVARQRTLRNAIECVGVGLHSGREVNLRLRPAAANTGIVIRRSDLDVSFAARFDLVMDTRLCTLLFPEGQPDARVGTVEHVMAALAATGITNAIIEVDGPEIPVLDGSASPFLFLIDCAGVLDQVESARVIEILRPVRVEDGDGYAELLPSAQHPSQYPGLHMEVSIDFSASVIGRQSLSLALTADNFRHELSTARTFAMAAEIDALRKAGLARGGSLDNAVVVDGDRVLNPAGLHSPDEFVRHKMLDAVGDLYLAGGAIHGRFRAHRPGHALNNRLLRALFADPANYAIAWSHENTRELARTPARVAA